MFMMFEFMFPIIFVMVFGMIIFQFATGIGTWHKNNQSPRLSVNATIVAKRENITHHSHANAGDLSGTHGYHSTSSTSYYVTFQVAQIKKPLENYRDIDAFKIYVSDLGLLCAKKDLVANDILYMVEELNDFKGGMTENYVNVQLSINGYNTYYWESERGAEIDFIIQRDGQLIPIEVKSADNTSRHIADEVI